MPPFIPPLATGLRFRLRALLFCAADTDEDHIR